MGTTKRLFGIYCGPNNLKYNRSATHLVTFFNMIESSSLTASSHVTVLSENTYTGERSLAQVLKLRKLCFTQNGKHEFASRVFKTDYETSEIDDILSYFCPQSPASLPDISAGPVLQDINRHFVGYGNTSCGFHSGPFSAGAINMLANVTAMRYTGSMDFKSPDDETVTAYLTIWKFVNSALGGLHIVEVEIENKTLAKHNDIFNWAIENLIAGHVSEYVDYFSNRVHTGVYVQDIYDCVTPAIMQRIAAHPSIYRKVELIKVGVDTDKPEDIS